MSKVRIFLIMFIFWIVLSGKFDPFHLTLGVISCLIVTILSHDLLFPPDQPQMSLKGFIRFCLYIPWLMWEIIMANFHVAWVSLHPRMRELIDPKIVRFRSRLKGQLPKVTLANSITLTPGTITIKVQNDEFYIHALTPQSAEGVPGEMEEKIVHVFQEEN